MPRVPRLATVGAREWVSLPDWQIKRLVAKVDTGARTSCIDATEVQVDGRRVRFLAAVEGGEARHVDAPLVEMRWVRDSGGHPSLRPVVSTTLRLGRWAWQDEVTLFDRAPLRHRMLLGRRALAGRFVVDPSVSHLWPAED